MELDDAIDRDKAIVLDLLETATEIAFGSFGLIVMATCLADSG